MNRLFTGQNGNYTIKLYQDGTKIRECPYDQLIPESPESIDLKITNRCDKNCPYCHEMSKPNGQHGDLNRVVNVLEDLPPGTELAIGGGNPLEHPELILFLKWCKLKGFISNLTVHSNHVKNIPKEIFDNNLIYGLGISYNYEKENLTKKYFGCEYSNAVCHLIIGIHSIDDISNALDLYGKVLILGFKYQGRAKTNKLNDNKKDIELAKNNLWKIVAKNKGIISFDNLAIQQLNLKSYFDKSSWVKFYMGDDGQFTMYYDAVLNLFGVSSTQPRQNMVEDNIGVINYFQNFAKK